MGNENMTKLSNKRVLREQRRRDIVDMIHQQGTASSQELANHFDVSLMTIWRDLKVLEDQERFQRVHGGAASPDNATIEPIYTHKKSINSRQKDVIAQYACKHFVQDGQIII